MAEVNDAVLAEYQQAHTLLKSLYADAGEGMNFRKLVKKVYPKASIPELDAVTRTEEIGSDLDKRFKAVETTLSTKMEGFLSERAKEKEELEVNAFSARIDKIVKDRGYTKEGTEKLLGLMKERGIQDPDDAVVIFESRQPKEAPKARQHSSRMNFITPDNKEDESFKRLMADPEQFMVDEMMAAFATPSGDE